MVKALWTAASGMQAQQTNIDVISNNLANVNTPGFKSSQAQFEDIMYETQKTPGAKLSDGSTTATGLQIGYGTKPVATAVSFVQGDLQSTGNQLDLGIQGNGFFQIDMPDGTFAYTRDGSFKMNAQGQLVTNEGYKLANSPTFDPKTTSITIAADGTTTVVVNGASQQISPITLSNFPNPAGLQATGDNLYTVTDASGPAETGITPGQNGTGTIAQGFIESSNVQIVQEMVRMIQAQRTYEINSKAIQTVDQMMSMANNLRSS